MNENKSVLNLVNPEFQFGFNGKEYTLRKATLDKAIQYQVKIKELERDPASNAKLIAYCIFIMLKEQEPNLTEEIILNNTPADIDGTDLLVQLGFINPTKLAEAKKIMENLLGKKPTGETSSSS